MLITLNGIVVGELFTGIQDQTVQILADHPEIGVAVLVGVVRRLAVA